MDRSGRNALLRCDLFSFDSEADGQRNDDCNAEHEQQDQDDRDKFGAHLLEWSPNADSAQQGIPLPINDIMLFVIHLMYIVQ